MKKILSLVAVAAMAAFATLSCVKDETDSVIGVKENADVPVVQGIQITSKANSVVIGETLQLEVSIKPETAEPGAITWESADNSIATVSSDGTVTAVSAGIVRVSATMGNLTSSAIINVLGERVPATEIVLSRKEKATVVGRSFTLTATLAPQETTDQRKFTWSSSNDKVATVIDGYVTAVGEGSADIIVAQDGLSATCKVSVGQLKLSDMASSWKITNSAKWNKNWSGAITGWSGTATLESCDATNHYFAVVKAKDGDDKTLVNEFVNEVESKKEGTGNPASLFSRNVPETKEVNGEGDYIAYVLGYDEEYEFEGDYLIYRFTATEPDPTHATGIKFTQGYYGDEITSITLKAGKSMQYFKANLLPDDCTDTGDVVLSSTDEKVVTITPYYGSYYTVTAVGPGTAAIKATFQYKDLDPIVAEIPVTVESGLNLIDCTNTWTYTYGTGDDVSVSLISCSDSKHKVVAMDKNTWEQYAGYGYYPSPGDALAVANWAQDNNYVGDVSDALPHKANADYYGSVPTELIVYVFGMNADGEFTGKYAHWEIDRSVEPQDPGTPSKGAVASIDGQYFPVDWASSVETQDNVTMEAWFNSSSFSGGKDNIYTIMGTEGIFQLRFEGSQLNLVYGGTKRDNGEYSEKKVTCSTNFNTGEWHHVAATYVNGGAVILYVDGEEVGRGSAEAHGIELNGVGANWVLPFKFYVGVSSNNRVWKGNLAEARVWSVARSASEIQGSMRKSLASGSGLMASWPVNEGSGNVLKDASGNGYNLTAEGGNISWSEDADRPF